MFALHRALFLVYGGFLLGPLTQSFRDGVELVFWPWALVFLLMLAGLVVWQSRRAPGGGGRGRA